MSDDIQRLTNKADAQLEVELHRKERVGAEKYGEWAFLQNPTLEMAMDEIIDLINYAKFTYRKLYIMNEILQAAQRERPMPQEGFIPTSKLYGDPQ